MGRHLRMLRCGYTMHSRASIHSLLTMGLQSGRGLSYIEGMDTQMVDAPFRLSERAAAQITAIVQGQPPGAPNKLRVAVLAGGCSGFQYRFELDGEQAEDDLVVERDGAVVLVDPASLDLLAGSELDYSDALMGAHFTVRNPNAASACGCGTSFSVE